MRPYRMGMRCWSRPSLDFLITSTGSVRSDGISNSACETRRTVSRSNLPSCLRCSFVLYSELNLATPYASRSIVVLFFVMHHHHLRRQSLESCQHPFHCINKVKIFLIPEFLEMAVFIVRVQEYIYGERKIQIVILWLPTIMWILQKSVSG
jgi:hypothetical protein